jgi:hypothetical protein
MRANGAVGQKETLADLAVSKAICAELGDL